MSRKARPGIRFNEHIEGDGPTVFAHACKMGLEGIVSKRKDSAYRSGRSPDWLKMKNVEKDQTHHQINERMMAQWTRRLGIFTFFMALIAGITAWILYETDQTARNAARAYLISNELTIETIRTKEGKISRWIISPIIENGGSTSTVNATIVTGLKALEAPMTEPREIVVLDKKDTRHFVLGPRSKNSKIVGPMHITPESLPALRSGNPRTFVLGEVNYDDVYAAPHVTRFCYFLWAYPENIGIEDITYSLCTGRSNCTDKECEQKK